MGSNVLGPHDEIRRPIWKMLATPKREMDAEKAALTGIVGLVGETFELGAFHDGHSGGTDRSAAVQANGKIYSHRSEPQGRGQRQAFS